MSVNGGGGGVGPHSWPLSAHHQVPSGLPPLQAHRAESLAASHPDESWTPAGDTNENGHSSFFLNLTQQPKASYTGKMHALCRIGIKIWGKVGTLWSCCPLSLPLPVLWVIARHGGARGGVPIRSVAGGRIKSPWLMWWLRTLDAWVPSCLQFRPVF